MNRPAKGSRVERQVKRLLESGGYSVVRGAASKGEMLGQKVDLVATKETPRNEYTVFLTLIGVQCKIKARRKA